LVQGESRDEFEKKNTLAIFVLCAFLVPFPIFLTQLFASAVTCLRTVKIQAVTVGTCWTLLVTRQHAVPEHTKLLLPWDTLAIFISFSFLFPSPHFSDTVLFWDLQSPVPNLTADLKKTVSGK
jgi:hypothetical protein